MNPEYHLKNSLLFCKNLCKLANIDINYDECKNFMLGNKMVITNQEKRAKSIFDSFYFLLLNKENFIDESLIKKWFYLFFEKEINQLWLIKFLNEIYKIDGETFLEKLEHLTSLLKQMTNDNIITLQWFYFLIYRNSQFSLQLNKNEVYQLDVQLNTKQKITKESIIELIINYTDEKAIKPKKITKHKIIHEVLINKSFFKNDLKIEHICLFGSFAKNENTQGSDIDLLVTFQEGLSYQEKQNQLKKMKEKLFKKLKRKIDVLESINNDYQQTMQVIKTAIKIF